MITAIDRTLKAGNSGQPLAAVNAEDGAQSVNLAEEKLQKMQSQTGGLELKPVKADAGARAVRLKDSDTMLLELLNKEKAQSPKILDLSKPDAKFMLVLRIVLAQNMHFGKINNKLYVYERLGYYKKIDSPNDIAFHQFLLNLSDDPGFEASLDLSTEKRIYRYLVSKKGVAVDLADPLERARLRRFVNFQNGIYDLKNCTFMKGHSPEFYFLWIVQAKYDQAAKMSERTRAYFRHITPNQIDHDNMRAVIGIVISNIRNLQLSGFIIGDPANGKSTLLNLLKNLLPPECSIPFSLSDFANKFAIGNLDGVGYAYCTDLEAEDVTKSMAAKFKRVVSLDPSTGEKKYVQVAEMFMQAFLLFAGNAIPYIDDDSGAVGRRILKIDTGAQLTAEQQKTDMLSILEKDRDAIVTDTLPLLQEIYNGTRILESPPEKKDFFQATSDVQLFKIWASEHLEKASDDVYVTETELLEDFKKYAEAHFVRVTTIKSTISLGMRIKKLLPAAIVTKGKNSAHIMYGYRLKRQLNDCGKNLSNDDAEVHVKVDNDDLFGKF